MGTGASEPDKATQLMMEACGIEVVEGGDGEGSGNGYEFGGFGGGQYVDPIIEYLDTVQDRAARWRERAIASRAASRLNGQWSKVATAFSENSDFNGQIQSYRLNTDKPTSAGLFRAIPDWSDTAGAYNANLGFIDIECGALMRTLP